MDSIKYLTIPETTKIIEVLEALRNGLRYRANHKMVAEEIYLSSLQEASEIFNIKHEET